MDNRFGELVGRAMSDQSITQGKLAALVGVYNDDDGTERYLDPTQVRQIALGRRRPTRGLVARLVECLELNPWEAWPAAGLWPTDLEPEDYRRLLQAKADTWPIEDRRSGQDRRHDDDDGRAA